MNFYEYLGVHESASTEQIRQAFRKTAKKTHPDYNKKDSAFWEMVELNIIRDTLLNPEKRREYDLLLKNPANTEPVNNKSKASKDSKTSKSAYTKTIYSLFVYRCVICGHEMSSTWRGYCLYHYLEYTNQLHNNEDFIFEYGGRKYQWADPPDELRKKHVHMAQENL